jgi:hypothetical protein
VFGGGILNLRQITIACAAKMRHERIFDRGTFFDAEAWRERL